MRAIEFMSEGMKVERHNVSDVGTQGAMSTTKDPHYIFRPDPPVAAGWRRVVLDMESELADRPQVFFDFGDGFSEVFSTRLRPLGGTRFVSVLKLPFPAHSIRLDPIDTRGAFRVDGFRIESPSPLSLASGLARRGLRLFALDPRAFVARLPEYWTALRQPRFIQMRERLRSGHDKGDYESWIREHDYDARRDRARLAAAMERLKNPPLISVVMPVYNTPEHLLREAIASVQAQVYPHWELCIADDHSTEPHVRHVLEECRRRDPRIKIVFREKNGHISHATNSAFALAEGEWIALLDHDDLLREHALAEVAHEIDSHPDAQLIYSDEDKLDTKGNRYDPYCKPDFSRELFRSQNYLNHLTVHRADNIRAVGGWRPGYEGSQDYDLNLRICEMVDPAAIRHIPKILYHWRAVEGSTAAASSEKSYAYDAGFRALQEHVTRTGLDGTVEAAPDTPFYRIRMKVPKPAPLVSLVVPTRDKADLLRNCVESIRARTTYPNYEILIVDNGSEESATMAYFKSLEGAKNVRVIRYDKPFNYSAINNFAVKRAKGEVVGLINNDIEVISPDWLTEMVSWTIQPDIGCVGAKLCYADGRIQHAGVILGMGGVAAHWHSNLPRESPGYFGRLKVVQNLSAVTGACLLVRKSVYEQVGGLDEEHLKVAFNDVDFCLKVREAGYLNVWTPFAELYHLESVSRGIEDPQKVARFRQEISYMEERWSAALANDPYYSPNLTLDLGDLRFRSNL